MAGRSRRRVRAHFSEQRNDGPDPRPLLDDGDNPDGPPVVRGPGDPLAITISQKQKTIMKKQQWLDGKQQEYWPVETQIGWSVITAGWVDLDLEDQGVEFNTGRMRILPPGLPMILKHIDSDGFAYTYRDDNSVMRMPAELLEPWKR